MGRTNEVILPTHYSSADLSNKFNTYFVNKIDTIRRNLGSLSQCRLADTDVLSADVEFKGDALNTLSATSIDEVKKIVMKSATKSCELDPIPASLLKQSIDYIIPVITDIINASLRESTVPQSFREAIVRPLLKKTWTETFLRTTGLCQTCRLCLRF